MPSARILLAALDEREIARRIGIPHDTLRLKYSLDRNIVDTFDEFSEEIGKYYKHHFSGAVSAGGTLGRDEAVARAKEILERQYRRRNGDILSAFNDAHEGLNGGMRVVLDYIAEGIKFECVERYIREVFDRYVAPNDWEAKVELMTQFMRECGGQLAASYRADQPERYAQNYKDLIRAYTEGLQATSSIFRRL